MSDMVRVALITGRHFRHLTMIDRACRGLDAPDGSTTVVGGLVQSGTPPLSPKQDALSRSKRITKRLMHLAGLRVPVYLDLDPAERHLWREHGEPRITWQAWLERDVLVTTEPNGEAALGFLDRLAPDLVLVFGGKILAPPWFERPRLGAMNLHYGMTPDYRGAESIVWAAYHHNWSRIGATIHYLDAGVDTGQVIEQVPVSVEPGDDLDHLTARVYWAGMDALIRCAVQTCELDTRLKTTPRSSAKGRAYPSRTCTLEIRRTADRHIRGRARAPDKRIREAYRSIHDDVDAGALHDWARGRAHRSPGMDELPAGVYILLYHDVSLPDQRPWGGHCQISTTPERFREHLEYVSDHGLWVSGHEAYSRLATNRVDRPLFVLTFDDGFASVQRHAAPIVDDLGIQPILFVNGATVSGEHVHYRLLAGILMAEGRGRELACTIQREAPRHRLRSVPVNGDPGRWLKRQYIPGWTDSLVTSEWHQHHDHLPTELFLNLDQLCGLASRGWEIGNHTWTHARLSRLAPSGVAEELQRNEQWLIDALGDRPDWVAYPYGFWNDVGAAALEWVESDPQRIGFMADGGINFVLDRLALRRIPVADHEIDGFRCQLFASILGSQRQHFNLIMPV